jgi:hypothetical protein
MPRRMSACWAEGRPTASTPPPHGGLRGGSPWGPSRGDDEDSGCDDDDHSSLGLAENLEEYDERGVEEISPRATRISAGRAEGSPPTPPSGDVLRLRCRGGSGGGGGDSRSGAASGKSSPRGASETGSDAPPPLYVLLPAPLPSLASTLSDAHPPLAAPPGIPEGGAGVVSAVTTTTCPKDRLLALRNGLLLWTCWAADAATLFPADRRRGPARRGVLPLAISIILARLLMEGCRRGG